MNAFSLPLGEFTCSITLEVVRPIKVVRLEEDGVTYLTACDYELTYRTTLRFHDGVELPIVATIFGDLNKQIVIRNALGQPERFVGYVHGRSEIRDANGGLLFEGHYYDTRISGQLTGDENLTPTGTREADHWENSFGKGAYAGHAFSLSVHFMREGNAPMSGQGKGRID